MNAFVPIESPLNPAFAVRSALVIDGNELQLVPISKALSHDGVPTVRGARDGVAAIEAMRSQDWDLVVLDLDMVQTTGLQLIDILADRGSNAALVLASGQPSRLLQSAAAYAESRGVRVVAAVRKPLQVQRIKSVLQDLEFSECQVFSKPSNEKKLMDFSSEELRGALLLQQIQPYYQPQHHMLGGVLRGAEMLARWHHPDGSVLTPAAFLPAFEEEGLLEAFTDYMLARAFECLADHGGAAGLQIAVNVPATVADSVHWAQSVADRAEAAGVDPGRLVIEITEDGGERCNRTLVGAITQLRLRGFSCAIDDFGSGDSSLDRLLRVPFSELKINRDMIQQARNHPHARSILASTIAMGKQLVATVVAEGIEDDEDLEMVRSLGCQVTQGYLHAKPLCRAAYARYCTRFNN